MDEKSQNKPSNKKIIEILLVIYTIAILYFMFFGFNRLQFGLAHQEYRFNLVPTGIPLWFPKNLSSFAVLKLWMISLGNLLVFVPFGIFIPMIFGTKYRKFIFIFLVSIISLEILQMVTYLGSFDIEDILINTIGASIGFISSRTGNNAKSGLMKILVTVSLVLISSFMLIVFAEILRFIKPL